MYKENVVISYPEKVEQVKLYKYNLIIIRGLNVN